MDACVLASARLALSSPFSPGSSPQNGASPIQGGFFPLQLTQLTKSFPGIPAGQSNLDNSSLRLLQPILDCAKVTVKTSHHRGHGRTLGLWLSPSLLGSVSPWRAAQLQPHLLQCRSAELPGFSRLPAEIHN